MIWREFIQSLCSDCRFSDPADPRAVAEAERVLEVTLPAELAELLRESDGVSRGSRGPVIWSIDTIRKTNLQFRADPDFAEFYEPFDTLLFFCNDASGNQFAYRVADGRVTQPGIFLWDHETDERTWVAASLQDYLQEHLSGNL